MGLIRGSDLFPLHKGDRHIPCGCRGGGPRLPTSSMCIARKRACVYSKPSRVPGCQVIPYACLLYLTVFPHPVTRLLSPVSGKHYTILYLFLEYQLLKIQLMGEIMPGLFVSHLFHHHAFQVHSSCYR